MKIEKEGVKERGGKSKNKRDRQKELPRERRYEQMREGRYIDRGRER